MAFALSLTPANGARAGVLAGGSSEFTQVANNIQLGAQVKQTGEQLVHVRDTLNLLKNNFDRLGPSAWRMYRGALNDLAEVVRQSERTAFSLARADEEFERRFAEATGLKKRAPRFGQAYQQWWQRNRTMVHGVLGKVGMKARDFRNQRAGLQKLQSLSRNPQSRDQILQAANELAVAQARQLQELQEIGMQQIALQGSAFTAEQEQLHHERDAMRRALRAPRLYRGNEKKY